MNPRYRWIRLYTIGYVVIFGICSTIAIVMNHYDPPDLDHPVRIINIVEGVSIFVGLYLLFLVFVGAAFSTRQYAPQSELDAEREDQTVADAKHDHRDYPGVTVIPEYSPPTDGPGIYRIVGVSRETKDDVTKEVQAESAANAKVKAELDGIVVTSVTRIGEVTPAVAFGDIDAGLPGAE